MACGSRGLLRQGTTALVLGVQTQGFNIANSHARKARSLNADAIISLLPTGSDSDVIVT
jgi:hypothetical protein